jgi:nucleotide-binding universal stress UspA family protein
MTALAAAAGNAPNAKVAGSIRRILLATDLSSASEGAAIQGIELAHDLGADLVVVSVIDAAAKSVAGFAGLRMDRIRATRETAAQAIAAQGRRNGVKVSFLVWEGEPGQAIVEAAASEQVDLVIVGSHGRGAVGRFILGSVSDFVVRHAPCPVLVVRGRAMGTAVA